MLDDLELSLLAFPQEWTEATRTHALNLIVLPVGDPTGPIGTVPVFGGTTLKLVAHLQSGDALPTTGATAPLSVPYSAVPPTAALPLLKSMRSRLPSGATVTTGKITAAQAPPATVRVMKSLPPSYTQAFPFSRPRDPALFVTGDGYGCAVEAQAPAITVPSQPKPAPPPNSISWGQILSYIVRQPLLAQACGLLFKTMLTIPANLTRDTAWVYFSIDTSTATNPFAADVASNPDHVRSFAARLPALSKDRRVFAATLFPLLPTTSVLLATPDQEAQTYDDGFAQVVHFASAADGRYRDRQHGRDCPGCRAGHPDRLGRRAGNNLARPTGRIVTRPGEQHPDKPRIPAWRCRLSYRCFTFGCQYLVEPLRRVRQSGLFRQQRDRRGQHDFAGRCRTGGDAVARPSNSERIGSELGSGVDAAVFRGVARFQPGGRRCHLRIAQSARQGAAVRPVGQQQLQHEIAQHSAASGGSAAATAVWPEL